MANKPRHSRHATLTPILTFNFKKSFIFKVYKIFSHWQVVVVFFPGRRGKTNVRIMQELLRRPNLYMHGFLATNSCAVSTSVCMSQAGRGFCSVNVELYNLMFVYKKKSILRTLYSSWADKMLFKGLGSPKFTEVLNEIKFKFYFFPFATYDVTCIMKLSPSSC